MIGQVSTRLTLALAATTLMLAAFPAAGMAACANPVACENEKAGSAPSAWQVSGSGDSTIQGYATSMSVNVGGTIRFKVKSTASAYHIDIYRLGYYQGNGARLQQANVRPTASLPQTQPACQTDSATGLIDCGNWGVSASWTVPSTSVSGVYIARLIRDDNGGASQIPFVVRDDAAHSAMLVRTSDATWQAYNKYGGNSLYSCTAPCPPGNPNGYKGAFSVSYNRPFDGTITQDNGRSYLFYAEYQMIRFLERNGYDASYMSQADVSANAGLLLNHKVIISSGHDEYWSGQERTNVEAARDAGVSLAFFSGNEVYWKTRWQSSSADGTATQYRTLTTYKDTHFDAPTDPTAWTGTWRDPRFAAVGDSRPENALTGQLFIINSGSSDITVPSTYKNLRLWRNTAVASLANGQSRTLAPGNQTLGYEWDLDVDNGFRPRGSFRVSSTTVSGVESFTDFGTFTKQGTTQTHNMTEYKAPSGAIVFGAGTVQWAWGLDDTNAWNNNGPPAGATPDPVMQQATVNLFADMGVPATTLMSGLTAVSQSTDTTAPNSTISSPSAGAAIADGSTVTISGTATDSGGQVAGIEVSTDGGSSWHPATGTTTWSYSWNAHGSPTSTIMSRAVDDSGNVESSSPSVTVNVGCPCTMAGPNTTPWVLDQQDPSPVEVGVRFKADMDGQVTGVRFYKSTANTGSHVGNLWTSGGTLLATGTFSGESATGWQQLNFTTPVDITAGTTYVASYYAPRGHYSVSSEYYYTPSPVGGNSLDSPPLHAINANRGGANGVYTYAGSSTFPSTTYDGENYGVDVVFAPKLPPGAVSNVTATPGPGSATVNFTAPATGGPPTRYIVTPYIGSTAQSSVTVTGAPPVTSVKVGDLDPAISYTFKVQAGNGSGTGPLSAASNAVTPNAPDGAGRPDGPGGQRRQPAGDRALDRAQRRRAHDHPLHRHAVPQRRRPAHDFGDRLARADHGGGNGPQQRLCLYVHRDGDELGGHRSRLRAVERGDPERHAAVRPEGHRQQRDRLEHAAHPGLSDHDRQPDRRHGGRVELQRRDHLERQRRRGQHLHQGRERQGVRRHRAQRLDGPHHRGRRHQAGHHHHRDGQRGHRRGCERVLGALGGGRRGGGRPAQDGHRHGDRGRVRHLRSDPGPDGRQRPGDRLLRGLRVRPHAVGRPELHRAGQRLAAQRHGVRDRGRAAAARRHARGPGVDGLQHAVDDGHRRLQERDGLAARALGLADEPGLQRHGGRLEPGGQDAHGDQRRRRHHELDGRGERELADACRPRAGPTTARSRRRRRSPAWRRAPTRPTSR
jgi:hypothetical protein